MSIEIDILNGDAARTTAEPLLRAVWPPEAVAELPWGRVAWANPDLRVLIDAPDGGLGCHVGIHFRSIVWNGHQIHIGGIGGVATRDDCRGRGYASIALNAAIETVRANEAARFLLLFCEAHNVAFYEARGWERFTGDVYCEQPDGRVRFEAMAPFVFDIKQAPRQGTIDLCGLPW